MTKITVPKDSRGCGGGEDGNAGGRWKEWVEVTQTIAPGDHTSSFQIVNREVKWVKLDRTIIVISGKTMNGNQILNNVKSN
jgi:hypothetical protein